ncbi:MAG TPA: protease, partial [Chitinophagaceae bacterium]
MKKHLLHYALYFVAMFVLASCTKDVKETEEIPQDVISRIADLGFNTSNVQVVEEGYLVEGDIIIPTDRLNETPDQVKLRIAEVEQYCTYNLVERLPREIT